MRRCRLLFLLGFSILSFALPFGEGASAEIAPEPYVKKDVPFVPTPEEVVVEMLRMAEVGEGDVLYDLGCGDGRIVITAAREWGVRGVGVDIDPERIRESRDNAEEAGVGDRVVFLRQNLFDMNLEEASVLTLYLLPEVNLRLRPKILRELAPGARVVSHDFDMDDWKPDATSKLGSHDIFFWVVPANVGGRWEWTGPGEGETGAYRMDLDQSFQNVSGYLSAGGRPVHIPEASLRGDTLRIRVEPGAGGPAPYLLEGRVEGNVIEGTMRPLHGGTPQPWTARRQPGTVTAVGD